MALTPHVLVVAGSDSSGGAGVARDVETVAAHGLSACLAVTAVTVQTHGRVEHVEPVAPRLIAAQMRAALAANPVAAVKIGMLCTRAAVETVAGVLADHPAVPAVLDPVLVSSSGRPLLDDDALAVLRQLLMPLCRLVTPNIPELAVLTGWQPASDMEQALVQGRLLLGVAPALLLKGGHGKGEDSVDLLLRRGDAPRAFRAPRVDAEMRGTGCMLATAIAACLAIGLSLEDSVATGKRYVFERLEEVQAARAASAGRAKASAGENCSFTKAR